MVTRLEKESAIVQPADTYYGAEIWSWHPTKALAQPKGAPVTVEGEIVEKCPVAGCWFVLRDATGTVRVDTKQAGFVVVDVPLHAHVTVSATVAAHGEEPGLAAVGLRR